MIASPQEIDGAEVAAHYDALDHFYRDVWGFTLRKPEPPAILRGLADGAT